MFLYTGLVIIIRPTTSLTQARKEFCRGNNNNNFHFIMLCSLVGILKVLKFNSMAVCFGQIKTIVFQVFLTTALTLHHGGKDTSLNVHARTDLKCYFFVKWHLTNTVYLNLNCTYFLNGLLIKIKYIIYIRYIYLRFNELESVDGIE